MTTATLHDAHVAAASTSGESLSEQVGDAALLSLLRGKPTEEAIPLAVWWLVAEVLRTSVEVRRAAMVPTVIPGVDVADLVAEARLLTDAALVDLSESTGARPCPVAPTAATGTQAALRLHLSVLTLARQLVTSQLTDPDDLATALLAHREALAGS